MLRLGKQEETPTAFLTSVFALQISEYTHIPRTTFPNMLRCFKADHANRPAAPLFINWDCKSDVVFKFEPIL